MHNQNIMISSRFSQSWSPFSKSGLNLEEFIVDVIAPLLLPFCVKEFIVSFRSVYRIRNLLGVKSKADLADKSALSFLQYGLSSI